MSLENAPQDAPLTDVVERTPSLRRAYVLFMDIIGFGRLKTAQQVAAQKELSRIVQEMPEVVAARMDPENFIVRPTGDGMALLFFKDLLSPLRCAFQIHMRLKSDVAEIKKIVGADIKLRMGIHAGEVTLVEDMNHQTDAAGDGIITAQRVMDLGDEDHILLSEEVAKVLKNIEPWAHYLTDLGEVRVKHKVIVRVFNLYGRLDGPFCGNPSKPQRVSEDSRNRAREARSQRASLGDLLLPYRKPIIATLLIGGLGYGGYTYNKNNNGALVKMLDSARKSVIASFTPPTNTANKNNKGKNGKSSSGSKSTSSGGSSGGGTGRGSVDSTSSPKVPRVVGDDFSVAEQSLLDNGFKVVREDVKSDKPTDQVVGQSPSAGSKLASGGTVHLRVSVGRDDIGESGNGGGEETKPEKGGEVEGGAKQEGGASGGE